MLIFSIAVSVVLYFACSPFRLLLLPSSFTNNYSVITLDLMLVDFTLLTPQAKSCFKIAGHVRVKKSRFTPAKIALCCSS
jgi:hypothetical protein